VVDDQAVQHQHLTALQSRGRFFSLYYLVLTNVFFFFFFLRNYFDVAKVAIIIHSKPEEKSGDHP
jgi:hypothetical protein